MNKKAQKDTSINSSKPWLIGSAGATTILIIGYSFVDMAVSSGAVDGNTSSGYAGLAGLFAIASSIICAISIFKAKKWWKMLPIVCLIVCFAIGCLAFFAYSFLKDPSITF